MSWRVEVDEIDVETIGKPPEVGCNVVELAFVVGSPIERQASLHDLETADSASFS